MLEILGTIGFDWRVALANLASFLIIFFILKKWVFGPVTKIIEERRAKIQEGISQAESSALALEDAEKEAEAIIAEARKEAHALMSQAKEHSDKTIGESKSKAEKEAEAILVQAKDRIEQEKLQAEKEVSEKMVEMVSTGVSRILKEDLTDAQHKSLVKRGVEIFS